MAFRVDDWVDTMRLWEVLWTDHLSHHFPLFVTMAVLHQHRHTILTDVDLFDELFKYTNELTGKLGLNKTLEAAQAPYYAFERRMKVMAQRAEKLQQRSIWHNLQERYDIQAVLKEVSTIDSPPFFIIIK